MTRLVQASIPNRIVLVPVMLVALAISVSAQTPIERRKNSYTPEQDVQLGREAAAQVRQQLPLLKDERTGAFVERIGERLIDEIPREFRQPQFQYTFEVVNLREINAFALPGGPMFLNRGMIQAARTEGEIAGVMAHELAHVMLRHGTAQATSGQKFQLGALLGQVAGAIIGGNKGAAVADVSQLGLGTWSLKYSRAYEREADLLGAQLLARAGYDPREMATMFETIEREGGNRGPEWLSSHPNPGNRVQAINREAQMLHVERRDGARDDLQQVHARLNQLPPAPTSEQVARARQQGPQPAHDRSGAAGPAARVELPSRRWRTHQSGDFLRLSVPANWQPIETGSTITYAPEGGFFRAESGRSVFTHGIEVGVTRAQGSTLQQQTDELLQGFARSNPQLRRERGYSRTTIGGRQGLTTTLSNVSDATGETEAVNVSTVPLSGGRLLFLIGVAPAGEAQAYLSAFGRVRQTVEIAEGR